MKRFFLGLAFVVMALAAFHVAGSNGMWGNPGDAGTIEGRALPTDVTANKVATQQAAIGQMGKEADSQILFGDLHVHTTFSGDAFLFSLPLLSGAGAHPVADACDFARFCSQLDFWSINDHAEYLTSSRWAQTVDTVRQCNAVAGDAQNPDMVTYLGWEWTQVGSRRENHYGHKNVILADLDDDKIPDRPIASSLGVSGFAITGQLAMVGYWLSFDSAMLDLAAYTAETVKEEACPKDVNVRDMPQGCIDATPTPDVLYRKLDEWGHRSIVIPHGTTWGLYTPQGSSWDKQLKGAMHDPDRQTLIEVYSGHGNSEDYRPWREYVEAEDGTKICPEPSEGYLPLCWRAGEIIENRCLEAGNDAALCAGNAAKARDLSANFDGAHPWRVVPGATLPDWLDAGQCADCDMPAFNYVPTSSAQYILALTNFDDPATPKRFRFGMMGSSDIHTARPGTGYKEYWRAEMTESNGVDKDAPGWYKALTAPNPEDQKAIAARPIPDEVDLTSGGASGQFDGIGSSLYTGGLIAVHADGRDRESIWDGMSQKNVYSTSGPRILLWFDAVHEDGSRDPMGTQLVSDHSPTFEVKALGSFEQKPGCPAFVEAGLTGERIEKLCGGECYNPSDVRRPITRIEIVRIRPQAMPGESMDGLIDDPWKVFECPADGTGCAATFKDEAFAGSGRDAVYYAKAFEAPSEAVNGGQLRCTRDEEGNCIATNPCYGSNQQTPNEDDCLGMVEERAWSSPIFVDHKAGVMANVAAKPE